MLMKATVTWTSEESRRLIAWAVTSVIESP